MLQTLGHGSSVSLLAVGVMDLPDVSDCSWVSVGVGQACTGCHVRVQSELANSSLVVVIVYL